jgi:hypothetical protein
MRRSTLTTIFSAGLSALLLGSPQTPAQANTNPPQAETTQAAPVTTQGQATANSSKATSQQARTRARQRARRRSQTARQNPGQAPRKAQPAAIGAGKDTNTDDASLARQQQEQAARLTRDQQQVLHQYHKNQQQMLDEPRIQDSLGDQPPPYAPAVWPNAQSQDPQGIQSAPGPAQTTPKRVPPPVPPPPPQTSSPPQTEPAPQ